MKEGQELKDLNYTLRLSTDYTQRLTNFLFMPYTFAGPQRNGDEYETFSAFQTLIDLSYIEQVTGETLLIKDPNLSTFQLLTLDFNWVKFDLQIVREGLSLHCFISDDCTTANGLSSLLQQQSITVTWIHPASLFGSLIFFHCTSNIEENCL